MHDFVKQMTTVSFYVVADHRGKDWTRSSGLDPANIPLVSEMCYETIEVVAAEGSWDADLIYILTLRLEETFAQSGKLHLSHN